MDQPTIRRLNRSITAAGFDVGNIRSPGLINAAKGLLLEPIGSGSVGMAAVGGARPERPLGFGPQMVGSHQPGDTVFTARDLLSLQESGHTGAAVGLTALDKGLFYSSQQELIGLGPRARLSVAAVVVAAGRHLQEGAQSAHRALRRQRLDHGIPFRDCVRGSMPRDFFSISLS